MNIRNTIKGYGGEKYGKEERVEDMVTIRLAAEQDYDAVERIMRQVHNMHVDWRPDIYIDTDPIHGAPGRGAGHRGRGGRGSGGTGNIPDT